MPSAYQLIIRRLMPMPPPCRYFDNIYFLRITEVPPMQHSRATFSLRHFHGAIIGCRRQAAESRATRLHCCQHYDMTFDAFRVYIR